MDAEDQHLEAFVPGLAVIVAVVDLLGDNGQAEETETEIVGEVCRVGAGAFSIGGHDVTPGEHAVQMGRHEPQQLPLLRIVGLNPVGQTVAQIHERIADGGQLPVQHPDDAQGVLRGEHQVVEAEIVVHDGGVRGVRRHAGREPVHDGFEIGGVVGAGVAVALRPAAHLPFDVPLWLADIVEPGGRFDPVQAAERFDEAPAQCAAVPGRQGQPFRQVFAQDDPPDALHDKEGAADDRIVGCVEQWCGAQIVVGPQRMEDFVFALHVVRRLGLGADRRPPQDEIAVGKAQPIGQVREAAGKLFDFQRASQLGHRFAEKGRQSPGGQRLPLAGLLGAVDQRHVAGASRLSFTW